MSAPQSSAPTHIAPFLIEPHFDPRVWGYQDLRPWYDRVVTAGQDPIGEVWLTGNQCRVATGPYAGKTLAELFALAPEALLGGGTAHGDESPLLIKVLFARDKLSVQVHPDDRLAQKYGEPRGKTECWYALSAEPGAVVAAGLKPGVTLEQVRTGIADGTLEDSLVLVPVTQGDMIFVDAGTVHAIWPGSILLETQQYSDTTYRMYDYGRPRELHVDRSLEATRLTTRAGKVAPRPAADRTTLIDEAYFCVEQIKVEGARASSTLRAAGEPESGLSYLFAAEGSARIESDAFAPIDLPARSIVAIPATSAAFTIRDLGGLDLIRISPRWPAAQ